MKIFKSRQSENENKKRSDAEVSIQNRPERIHMTASEDTSAIALALAEISDGNTHAVTVIYERMGRQILSLGRAITGSQSSCEDVLQETVLKIIENIHTYRKGGNAKAWIMAIARNAAIDMKNRASKFGTELDTDRTNLESGREYDFSSTSQSEILDVMSALSRLDDTDREIVVMKAMTGLKHKDIAKLLGITTDASKKRYRRALERLRALI